MRNLYTQNQKLKVTIYAAMLLALLSLLTFAVLNELDAITAFRGIAIGVVFFFVTVAIVADRRKEKNKKQLNRLTSLTR